MKKRINRKKCSFTTKQRIFGVIAIDKSFAIKEAPSPLSTLYVTLVSTQADDDANSVKACSVSLMSDLAFEKIH